MATKSRRPPTIYQVYRRLLRIYGPQQWWPVTSTFEVMVGAILTQATAWYMLSVRLPG